MPTPPFPPNSTEENKVHGLGLRSFFSQNSDESDYSVNTDSESESNLELDYQNGNTEVNEALTSLLSNLSLEASERENMALQAPPDFDAKLLNIVPQFDGNPLELSSYLDTVNTLISNYWDARPDRKDCVQNITIIYGVYAKLVGKAREVYSICTSKDWQSVKTALISHFGDQRDENGLLFDLDQLRQSSNESSLQFYTRVMSNLSALHNFIDIHEQQDIIKQMKKEFYNKHSLKIFLAGLKEPLGSAIRAMRPDDLATARQYIITENNIRYLQRPHIENKKPHNNNQNFNFPKNQNNQNFNFPNNYNFIPQNNFTPIQFPQQNQNLQFPRGPINVQPRQLPPQRFFTNKQVFGQPNKNNTNVFKPRNINPNNFPKPTPMSGISHGTSQQYRPQQQQKFRVQELFNIDETNDVNPYLNYSNNSYSDFAYPNYYNKDDETYNHFSDTLPSTSYAINYDKDSCINDHYSVNDNQNESQVTIQDVSNYNYDSSQNFHNANQTDEIT